MIGSIRTDSKKALIIGGGVSGLLAAYSLDMKGFEVTLLEAQNRVGGLIQTDVTPLGIAESAAHSFLATDTLRELTRHLGVKLLSVQDGSKARYILRKGQLRRFPLSFFESVDTFFHAAFKKAPDGISDNLTMEEWAAQHLGCAALRYLVTPMTRGIYGVDPNEICMSAAFPSLAVPSGRTFLGDQFSKRRSNLFSDSLPLAKRRIPEVSRSIRCTAKI